ncbi:MAG TPA: COX15/CtaA family protein [Vicinamibacterales bacterium]|nr:COX15/CtaA family protein [Vicinamibacterales bacterium]
MWLNRYARLVAASTLLLIMAGAMVTSTGSGLAVPDWPTSYGYPMFAFPLRYMVGGIFYEHGHRLIATTVGMLTIGLAAWLAWCEPRRWVRKLGWAALAAVILQGVLGGITVLYFLPAPVSIGHAALAQIFWCLVVTLAVVTSDRWRAGTCTVDDSRLRRLSRATVVAVYVQILLGAAVRHTGAGLAIPDFPLAFGGLLPPRWDTPIALHFAHRLGAVVVTVLVFTLLRHVGARHRGVSELGRPARLLAGLVIAQVMLGGWVVWSRRGIYVNSLHVATGALILGTGLVLALRVHRVLFERAGEVARPLAGAAPTPAGPPDRPRPLVTQVRPS